MDYDYEIIKENGTRYSYKIEGDQVVCYVDDVRWGTPQGERFIRALLLELIEKSK